MSPTGLSPSRGGGEMTGWTLEPRVLADLHENPLGSNRMKALARSYICWPSLDMTLEELCKKCEICQSQKNKLPAGIPHPWMYPTAPWESSRRFRRVGRSTLSYYD